ncbi:hypothetical protein GQ53DRAFT_334732 [Thozetella sp. PMI_491]|nr:hypothetical protein GQ53DRAFT_334732 [Thozetella sp. PMI_491]
MSQGGEAAGPARRLVPQPISNAFRPPALSASIKAQMGPQWTQMLRNGRKCPESQDGTRQPAAKPRAIEPLRPKPGTTMVRAKARTRGLFASSREPRRGERGIEAFTSRPCNMVGMVHRHGRHGRHGRQQRGICDTCNGPAYAGHDLGARDPLFASDSTPSQSLVLFAQHPGILLCHRPP